MELATRDAVEHREGAYPWRLASPASGGGGGGG